MNRREIDNAVLHCYPASPYIVKVSLNLRKGRKIIDRLLLSNEQAAINYLDRRGMNIGIKKVIHHG